MGLPKSTLVAAACWLSIAVSSVAQPAPKPSAYLAPFTGAQSGQTVTSQSGWIAKDAAGATTTDATVTINASGNIAFSGVATGATTPGVRIVVRDSGSTDCTVKANLATFQNGSYFMMVAAAVDAANAIYVRGTYSSTGEIGTVRLCKVVAGTETVIVAINPSLSGPYTGRNVRQALADELELRVINRTAYVYLNGVTIGSGSIDGGATFTKGQYCGFGTNNTQGCSVSGAYIAPVTGSLTLASIARFWPRTPAESARSIPVSGTYSGAVTQLHYRVQNPTTNAVVQDWAVMSGLSTSAGVWSGSISIPKSRISTHPYVLVIVRAYDDQDTASSVDNTVAVGLGTVDYGQSNAAFRNPTADSGTPTSANVYLCASANTSAAPNLTWSRSTENPSWGGASLGITLSSALDEPVGVYIGGAGSQPIDTLISTNTTVKFSGTYGGGTGTLSQTPWEALVFQLSRCGLLGRVAALQWTQGEAEAGATTDNETAIAQYRGKFLGTLLPDLRAQVLAPSAPVYVAVIGRWEESFQALGTSAAIANKNWSAMRAVLAGLADIPGVFLSESLCQVAQGDSLHMSVASFRQLNRQSSLCYTKALAGGEYDGRGPLVTGGTRLGAVITLTVNLNGATSISGSALTAYDVSSDDFATTLTVASVAVSGSTIVITLASAPAGSVKVRSFWGYNPDRSSMAIGTYADSTTIPVEPIYLPITVA